MKMLRYAGAALAMVLSALLLGGDVPAAGNVHIEFTTRPTGKRYSPKHVLAVWVSTENHTFVRTLLLRAGRQRKWLSAWQKASAGNTAGLTDATSGATRKQHETIRLDWDGRAADGTPLPEGSYFIVIEFSEQNGQGPVTPRGYIPLELRDRPFSVKPLDLDGFRDLRVSFTPPAKARSGAKPPAGRPAGPAP